MVKKSARLLKGPARNCATCKKLGDPFQKKVTPLKSTAVQTSKTKHPVVKT